MPSLQFSRKSDVSVPSATAQYARSRTIPVSPAASVSRRLSFLQRYIRSRRPNSCWHTAQVEFLPGKGTGCQKNASLTYATGIVLTLYVYNTDNPPEGTVAKRRCYATRSATCKPLRRPRAVRGMIKLDSLLFQYDNAKGIGPDNMPFIT